MELVLQNLNVFRGNAFRREDIVIRAGRIAAFLPAASPAEGARVLPLPHAYAFPGFTDVHVHLREPGFSYKETIASGSAAAAHGGYTDICAMPNLSPVPDSLATLALQQEIIARDAVIRVHPYAAITYGEEGKELVELAALAPQVVAFSDDGKGVQAEAMMRQAMQQARSLGKVIAAHCEDETLLRGGCIHDGAYARAHHLPGICSESEWKQVARDLQLAEETGCAYHICHVSSKESVQLIRAAKQRGVDVTAETAPHYLLLDESQLQDSGSFRMNPPLREAADREALLAAILDGTIDMIATDHAPHSAEEKAGGLAGSLNGIVGLETAFAMLYTKLVKPGLLPLSQLLRLLHEKPNARFGIGKPFVLGEAANFTVFDLDTAYTIDPAQFLSKGRSTPFAGQTVYGKCLLTLCDGKIVWQDESLERGNI